MKGIKTHKHTYLSTDNSDTFYSHNYNRNTTTRKINKNTEIRQSDIFIFSTNMLLKSGLLYFLNCICY